MKLTGMSYRVENKRTSGADRDLPLLAVERRRAIWGRGRVDTVPDDEVGVLRERERRKVNVNLDEIRFFAKKRWWLCLVPACVEVGCDGCLDLNRGTI